MVNDRVNAPKGHSFHGTSEHGTYQVLVCARTAVAVALRMHPVREARSTVASRAFQRSYPAHSRRCRARIAADRLPDLDCSRQRRAAIHLWKALRPPQDRADDLASKTWEGRIGGIASALVTGAVLYWLKPFSPLEAGVLAALSCAMRFFASLVASAIKRDRGVKD